MTRMMNRHPALCAVFFALIAAIAAPYLVPDNPDSSLFRSGTLGLFLIAACVFPMKKVLSRITRRQLLCGFAFGLIFAVLLSLGCELAAYSDLLPGMGSLVRRIAVPLLAAPLFGTLSAGLFSLRLPEAKRGSIPAPVFFVILLLCYGAVWLALYPGVVAYDFQHEYDQFTSGVFEAAHPVFHTLLLGVLYRLGSLVTGSGTGGIAAYSLFQLSVLAALYAWCLGFVQKRVPQAVTLVCLTMTALLPFHGTLAVSTSKDPIFAGLAVMLCLTLWQMAEDPDAFCASRCAKIRFALCCLFASLLRHNAAFAFLPACIALLILCRRRGILLCMLSLALSLGMPAALDRALNASSVPGTELLSVPCQQLLRLAASGEATEQETEDLSGWWIPGSIARYRAHCADPAKGGNFDSWRYSQHRYTFWKMYLKYAAKYPRVFLTAFLENCRGIWAPGDLSHAHSLSTEDNVFIYMNTHYAFSDNPYGIEEHSFFPGLRVLIQASLHDCAHEKIPVLSQLFCPATYTVLLLLSLFLLVCRRQGRFAAALMPLLFIAFSLFFSAGIFIRYAYPIMAGAPMLFALTIFGKEK